MSKSPKQLPNCLKVVPYTSGKIWSARLILLFLWQCLNISTVINIKILTNSNQQTQSYKFTSHIAAFLSVVLITEMLEICIQTSYDQNVQLILKSYLPVVYGTTLISSYFSNWLPLWADGFGLAGCVVNFNFHVNKTCIVSLWFSAV